MTGFLVWMFITVFVVGLFWLLREYLNAPVIDDTVPVVAHRALGQPTCCGTCVAKWVRDVELQRRVELEDLEYTWRVSP